MADRNDMKPDEKLLRQIAADLGLDFPFSKQPIPVRNCWHFSTDGNAIDAIFRDEKDFMDGMNRIYVCSKSHKVIILAFSLMDTHLHFILYGDWEECNRFMHDYVRRTSYYISVRHKESKKLVDVPIHFQTIDTDRYLKTAICYTVKNAPAGGIPFMGWDYPWSSGPLYFRRKGTWCSPRWEVAPYSSTAELGSHKRRDLLRTRKPFETPARMTGLLVFPGEYVAYEIVERLFKTCKSYNYFMCFSREDDVDSREGTISHLSIPMQEMRQLKNDLCKEMFGDASSKQLSTTQRLHLARRLHSRYNSSVKQIARLCGLVYGEVKDLI